MLLFDFDVLGAPPMDAREVVIATIPKYVWSLNLDVLQLLNQMVVGALVRDLGSYKVEGSRLVVHEGCPLRLIISLANRTTLLGLLEIAA